MLLDKLKERFNLVLLEKQDFKYVLYPSTPEEVLELQDLLITPGEKLESLKTDLRVRGLEIDMVGHLSEVQSSHIQNLIPPKLKTHTAKRIEYIDNGYSTDEYKCYQEHKHVNPYNNVIKHEEKLSSFRCACELLQAKYFIVMKEVSIISEMIKYNEMYNIATDKIERLLDKESKSNSLKFEGYIDAQTFHDAIVEAAKKQNEQDGDSQNSDTSACEENKD